MGNLPSSNLFCPSKDQHPPGTESLLDPPGHGACPTTVPLGMSRLVSNPASQHGSSTNIVPVDVRLAPPEQFAPVTSLPERHWQSALQATVLRPTPKDPKRSSDKNHNPFSPLRPRGRKNNDAPTAGGVKKNPKGPNSTNKHPGLYSATSGVYIPHPKHERKSSNVQLALHNADTRDAFFQPYFPSVKHIKHMNRAPKHAKYQASKKKPQEPKECAILSEKDLDTFTKQLERVCVHLDIMAQNGIPSPRSKRDIDHEEACATDDRRKAINEAHLAIKYYRTLRRQLRSRQSGHNRNTRDVMNIRANDKWRSTNGWAKNQSAMVSQLIDQGIFTPVSDVAFHPHCLDDEIEPGDDDSSEHYEEMYCQPVGTGTPPPMSPCTSNCNCPTLNVRANAKWRAETSQHH